MDSEYDIVKGHGWCMASIPEGILMTDERRPVECTGVNKIASEAYDILSQRPCLGARVYLNEPRTLRKGKSTVVPPVDFFLKFRNACG